MNSFLFLSIVFNLKFAVAAWKRILFEKCPNTEFFLVRILSECDKIRTRKNSVFEHFSRSEFLGYFKGKRFSYPFLISAALFMHFRLKGYGEPRSEMRPLKPNRSLISKFNVQNFCTKNWKTTQYNLSKDVCSLFSACSAFFCHYVITSFM